MPGLVPADAGVAPVADAPAGDAGIPEALASAPAWIFRYHTAQRTETWTLRHAGDAALLVVETAQGARRYLGSAADTGAALELDVTSGSAKLTLSCKHAKRHLGAKCNDTRAPALEALDCYHPDFKEPMPFGRAPGFEYVIDAHCTGYRRIAE